MRQRTLTAAIAQAEFTQEAHQGEVKPTILIFQAAEDSFICYPKEVWDELKPTSTRKRQLERFPVVHTVPGGSA